MKCLFFLVTQFFLGCALAQTPVITNDLVEGGKLFIDLVKIFKKNPAQATTTSDLCFTNSTADNLFIELSRKLNDSTYKPLPSAISLTTHAHECLLELNANVYHYKVYKKINNAQILSLEGELRLKPNEKMEQEIK